MRKLTAVLGLVALVATGCQSSKARARGSNDVLRLGIFPNLTHAPGYVALEGGIMEKHLGHTRVDVKYFNSGGEAGSALLGGSIDATYIGPGPAISMFQESGGRVRVVSGATSGGASLVVRTGSGIRGSENLRGKKVAVPGYGNTQDVALRTWLAGHGLEGRNTEGGDVLIVEVDNAQLPQLFEAGELDAAWEPEPYPSLLVERGLAARLIDETELWDDGRFVTTHLLVSTAYLEAHRPVVERLVRANVEAIELIQRDPEGAKEIARRGLEEAEAPDLGDAVVDAAWDRLGFTWDPVQASLEADARNAFELGILEQDPSDILRIYDLSILNDVLEARNHPTVAVRS